MTGSAHTNRLAGEPSLYLRQHAHNPVDWYPWGEEAFERARRQDKPILLSIGYSSCHWCHVMERECFENEAIARLMNDLFVCIKVDREERPDVDDVYMKTVQIMTGRGGWPMTVFTSPDLRPYYAGTYFPPEDRGGMPGFPRVLTGAAKAYRDQGEKVAESGERVIEMLTHDHAASTAAAPTEDDFGAAAAALAGNMDAQHGGFGNAPKFPGSLALSFLIGNGERDELVRVALDRMAAGGIHDQLGGGFHRYSVDRYWLVPHFEKMLYDQALLADLYTEAWTAYGAESYAGVAQDILDYVQREMVSRDGAFYSTQDADSEGVEGKFFVWSPEEVAAVVGKADADLVCRFYDVSKAGNFEGTSILRRTLTVEETAQMFERESADVERVLAEARAALLAARTKRIAPATDEKILADWNGLMIGAVARTARALGRADQVAVAARAADFVRAKLYRDGRLLHFFADGEARVDGFLDDHAFFGRGCLELYYALGRREDLDSALGCCDALIDRFADADRGGFYFSPVDGERLIARTRDLFDGAVPAGNSVAVELLLRCYQLTGEDRYREAGEAGLAAFLPRALANPYGAAHLLCTAQRYRAGLTTVIIVGSDPGGELERAALVQRAPGASVLVATPDTALPAAARGKQALEGRATAYVCRGSVCSAPVTSVDALAAVMGSRADG